MSEMQRGLTSSSLNLFGRVNLLILDTFVFFIHGDKISWKASRNIVPYFGAPITLISSHDLSLAVLPFTGRQPVVQEDSRRRYEFVFFFFVTQDTRNKEKAIWQVL